MIAEYLDRNHMIKELTAWRETVRDAIRAAKSGNPKIDTMMRQHGLTLTELEQLDSAIGGALDRAETDEQHSDGSAYIPSDPFICAIQSALTRIALSNDATEPVIESPSDATRALGSHDSSVKHDGGPTLRLKKEFREPGTLTSESSTATRGPFEEGDDWGYIFGGIKDKASALFTGKRRFNNTPAKISSTQKPLSLWLFGDWGTGLPLAGAVTRQIAHQLNQADSSRQPHVVHLGDVYYGGEPNEYEQRALPLWPVPEAKRTQIGSWSLNGNHDMYSGGHGYFDTLLRSKQFLQWHADDQGEPSSFFLIEDPHWQVFGLDSAWNTPSLASALFSNPTLAEYSGMNGILTPSQVKWMKKVRNPAKGCILLTHHQPAGSRTTEEAHSDEAVELLEKAGLYQSIDAWLWGHEHRCVIYKPKAQRTHKRLKKAPSFCACLGHGGVPVNSHNFEAAKAISDIFWEETLGSPATPIYDGKPVLPPGFARLDTAPGSFRLSVFDYTGAHRKAFDFAR